MLFSSCVNDPEKVNAITDRESLPNQEVDSMEILYTDSARIKLKITAPKLIRYTDVEKPYSEFPEGLLAEFYDDNEKIKSFVSSKYAKWNEADGLWELKEDVVSENYENGNHLNTEQLFWDQEKEFIYSDKFSIITNEKGIYHCKDGFEADQNMDKWKMKGIRDSEIYIEDE
jgi:LPS export ABC transporter protein LptC